MTEKPSHDAAGSDHDAAGRGGKPAPPPAGPGRTLSPAAKRALAEAEARRAEIDRKSGERPKELSGRGGPDPTRYGDWEVKGIASDF